MCEPSQTCIGTRDRGGSRLLNFMGQRGGQFAHHVDAIGVCEIGLQLTQLFPLLFSMFLFCYIHRDTDVFTILSGWIAMSYRTQEFNTAVGMTNSVFG